MFRNIYQRDTMKRADHEAVRNSVGWYYYTHQLIEVKGSDAAAFLDYIYPKNIGNLANGRARYTPMLNEKGIIRDDVVIFRMEENLFWVSTLYAKRGLIWLNDHKGSYDVECRDITSEYDMYSVQGPKLKELINALVKNNIDDQKFFEIRDNEIDGIPVKINRGGFTGEKWGYEIYLDPKCRKDIEAKLEEKGKAFDARHVTEFQVMVLTLPTEKGYYLMCDLEQSTPLEIAGFSKGINWDKEFIGKEALVRQKETGPEHELVGFILQDPDAIICSRDKTGEGAPVTLTDGEHIGYVTKVTYGFTVEKTIGYMWLEAGRVQKGDTVIVDDIAPYEAVITDTVFF